MKLHENYIKELKDSKENLYEQIQLTSPNNVSFYEYGHLKILSNSYNKNTMFEYHKESTSKNIDHFKSNSFHTSSNNTGIYTFLDISKNGSNLIDHNYTPNSQFIYVNVGCF